jgi:hypothetical protein
MVGITAKGNRQRANLFDQFERSVALLFADLVPQNAAQQAYVLHQGAFVVFCALGGGWGG